MAAVWIRYGDATDEGGREAKNDLLRSRAKGVIVDLGAGHGHTLAYLDWKKVTKYVAVEPSVQMHDKIREKAASLGLNEERILIISAGMEDIGGIERQGLDREGADTIVSILTLCSVPEPAKTIKDFCSAFLSRDGSLLFYEHVANPHPTALWWQRRWSWIWSKLFDGCRLDRPTVELIENVGIWRERQTWGKKGEEPNHLFLHQAGCFLRDPAK